MSLFTLFLLALVQGITEFLPISSSGHLILLPNLLGIEDQGQAIDVAVHVGTLGAVILYFWRDVKAAIAGTPRLLTGRIDTPGAKLAFLLIIATIPVIIFGLFLEVTGIYDSLRSIAVIGWTMLIFGLVLYWADQRGGTEKQSDDWSLRDAVTMGLWQAVALIPGTSRSGITITAARFLGYDRESAARVAMLMSIPTIIATGVFAGAEVIATADAQTARDGAIAAALSFLAALAALTLMFRLLKSVSFTPYVIYRVILGVILLVIAYA
ncbi:undecaprenyl-diphosphate phosphatase [Jannaschia sp. CCS1]|uniref:Undecaprenyl-diphosphatase n=1 Tax=Jannaschia sp. (strain CCS1) TaxID=290400 RepID=UPPP_JANSC|nr:undecaprenyl-diphosphate phosphatase [Jannaschia sp. CCS1]Q28VU8.1 RecName: Full=Undecaprenyl-diphosphatase; AltName: Full=Bacitracin resistance protein; AltName: Full=Undecaprenyl pyrophosphate phosphatase [Jannaschia sp. CCS1]ABD53164.1 Undecaprenyl-diphosphatase [Jannaschia sp. CCS1]